MSSADELKKLKDLLDSGVLTQEEFDTQKSKILSSESSDEPKVIIDDNKSKKNNSTFKWVIGVIVVVAVFALFSSDDSSSSTTTSSSSSSSSNSTCETWLIGTGNNSGQLSNIAYDYADYAEDAADGIISFSQMQSYLENDLVKVERLYRNQLSLTPNSSNQDAQDYLLIGIDYFIDAYEWTIQGLETLDPYYVELGVESLSNATYYVELSLDAINEC